MTKVNTAVGDMKTKRFLTLQSVTSIVYVSKTQNIKILMNA